ncbi:cell envelope integrity EipB family protein [uncultured Rhodoblastus sp.]|uniref:cell envelope integrity EipB family protein n=1 Tax=uncultured Rhodoblastus sp. TaxID=543037 RepID=UPI0025D355B1|nr:cell envelope integrity EipB family protein [uncultured Rhodoblastus sp.]
MDKALMRNPKILLVMAFVLGACLPALTAAPGTATAGPAMNDAAKPDAVKPDPASPALASHKAIYELRLLEGAGTKAPAGASGRIAFDFSSACEGYAQTLRQVVDMQPQEGERQITETRTTTYEDAKGSDFRFNVASAGGKDEEVDGHAERTRGALSIALTRPKPFTLSADNAVLFPTQHIGRVIAAASAGEKIFLSRVYDASDDGRKIFDVTAIIGALEQGPDADKGAQAANLRGLRRWPVALAYFPPNQRDGAPDYVLSFHLYENGVSSGLKLDYGDFVLTGELTEIEFPAPAKCRR